MAEKKKKNKRKKKAGGRFGERSALAITYDELIGFCARCADASNRTAASAAGRDSIAETALALVKVKELADIAAYASFAAVEILGVGEGAVIADILSAMETK